MLLGEYSSHIIDKFTYPGEEKNRDLEEDIVQLTKDQIRLIIKLEGQKICDRLIEIFKLGNQLKERYEDKNVSYKAKEKYTTGHATLPLTWHYFDKINKPFPFSDFMVFTSIRQN